MIELKLLLLLFLVNGAPIVASRAFDTRWSAPVDGGRRYSDGRRLLGPTKTWRGLGFSLVAGALGGWLLGPGPALGMLVAALAMAGDLAASFVKRRLGLAPSSQALGLDQIPESLLPLLACIPVLELTWVSVAVVTISFLFGGLLISRGLYLLGIRERPY